MIIANAPEIYQGNFRIYLDEYPEQKELREEWLKNKLIAKAIGEPYISNLPEPSIYEPFIALDFTDPYQHFIDRFNKRN